MMFYRILLSLIIISTLSCQSQQINNENSKEREEEIINTYLKNGAWQYHYLEKEWDEWINKGIAEDSTIAYLWQQKAMPLWKTKKYSEAERYFKKAVALKPQEYLCRFGFLKCIFSQDYAEAKEILESYIVQYGSTFEQDHPLEFYIGICQLQLREYDAALQTFSKSLAAQRARNEPIHYLDKYYHAVAYYELKKYEEAITVLDEVLEEYPEFADAQYYKSFCLYNTGKTNEAIEIMKEGKKNFQKGYTFNEDSSFYEVYPYQVTWQWEALPYILKN